MRKVCPDLCLHIFNFMTPLVFLWVTTVLLIFFKTFRPTRAVHLVQERSIFTTALDLVQELFEQIQELFEQIQKLFDQIQKLFDQIQELSTLTKAFRPITRAFDLRRSDFKKLMEARRAGAPVNSTPDKSLRPNTHACRPNTRAFLPTRITSIITATTIAKSTNKETTTTTNSKQ